MNDPVGQFGLAGLFLCWCAYGILTGLTSYPGASYALMLMVGAAGMALASKPRWIVYALLMGAFIVRLYSFVHVVANGSQDPQSIRDEAVEATRGLHTFDGHGPSRFRHFRRWARCSPTRKAFAMIVSAGFTAELEGKKLPSTT